jgi:hypothetical protein
VPPLIASIANCGDWLLGKVLDWQFAETGDAYLGRCLAGLDPNSSDFCVLPPHWNVASPLEDDDIKEDTQLMYANILRAHPSMTGVLVCMLASVVYAADWLIEVSSTYLQFLSNLGANGVNESSNRCASACCPTESYDVKLN